MSRFSFFVTKEVAGRMTWPFLVLGFGAGLPYLLVFSTLSAWLSEENIAHSTIGYLSLIGITYSLKFLWAPVIDHIPIPLIKHLGRRRSWLLVSQVGVFFGLLWMANCSPGTNLTFLVAGALVVAFASATQDLALDAFRIESLADEYQGIAVAQYIFGYRTALLCAGAGALFLADIYSWSLAYHIMAVLALIPMVMVLLLKESNQLKEPNTEPSHSNNESHHLPSARQSDSTLKTFSKLPSSSEMKRSSEIKDCSEIKSSSGLLNTMKQSFAAFFAQHGSLAIWLLVLIALYRLTDMSLGVMAIPFYLDIGFSKTEIATVSKLFGFAMTLVGSALGGWMVLKWGQLQPLVWGAWLSLLTNGLFILLEIFGDQLSLLAVVIGMDNLGGGIANVALVAFMSSLTQTSYTATQYALMSSLMTLLGKLISGMSGWVVDQFGFTWFFVYTAALGLPALWLSYAMLRHLGAKFNINSPADAAY